ncbi:MAG: alpha/beta fold hydrolase [Pseudomonadota bacterium]
MIRGEGGDANPALPVVWLHGWGMGSAVWGATPGWCGHGAAMLDLPGHGEQPWDEGLGDDLERWARALLDRAPARAVWVGWSLGGLLAMAAARLAPERVAGLTLLAASPRFVAPDAGGCGMASELFRQFKSGLEHDLQGTLRRFIALQTLGVSDARGVRLRLQSALDAMPTPDLRALRAGLSLLEHGDMLAELSLIRSPVRILLGGRDRLVPPCVAGRYARALPSAGIEILPEAGHLPFIHEPAALRRALDHVVH